MAKKYFDEEKVRALVKTFQESVVLDETEKIIKRIVNFRMNDFL